MWTISYRLVEFPKAWGWWRRRGGDVRRCGRSRRRGKFALPRLIHPVALKRFELCEGQLCLISHENSLGEWRTGRRGSSRRGGLQTSEIQRDSMGHFLEPPTQPSSLGSSPSSHDRLRHPDCHKCLTKSQDQRFKLSTNVAGRISGSKSWGSISSKVEVTSRIFISPYCPLH